MESKLMKSTLDRLGFLVNTLRFWSYRVGLRSAEINPSLHSSHFRKPHTHTRKYACLLNPFLNLNRNHIEHQLCRWLTDEHLGEYDVSLFHILTHRLLTFCTFRVSIPSLLWSTLALQRLRCQLYSSTFFPANLHSRRASCTDTYGDERVE